MKNSKFIIRLSLLIAVLIFFNLLPYTLCKPYLIKPNGLWYYTEDYPDSPPEENRDNWTGSSYVDANWAKGFTPIGYDTSDARTQALIKTSLVHTEGRDVYLRKNMFILWPFFYSVSPMKLYVASDNAAKVYLNGQLVDRDPVLDVAVHGHEYLYWNRVVKIDSTLLKSGRNTIAVFLDNNPGSSDAFFELKLESGWDYFWNNWTFFINFLLITILFGFIVFHLFYVFLLKELQNCLSSGKTQELNDLISRYNLDKSNNPATLSILIQHYAKSSDYENFLRMSLKYCEIQNNSPQALETLAQAYWKASRHGEAIETLKKIIAAHPGNRPLTRQAQKMLGEIYLDMGLLDLAESELKTIINKVPLGELLLQKKIIKESDLACAIKEQASSGDLLGQVLLRKGLLSSSALEEALKAQVDTVVIEKLAEIKLKKRDTDGASSLYQTVLSLDPKNFTAIYNIALNKFQQNNFRQAIPDFQKLTQTDSEFKHNAFYYLALCFLAEKRISIAMEYVHMLNTQNLSKDQIYALAEALENQNEYKDALHYYMFLLQKDLAFRDVEQKVIKIEGILSEAREPSLHIYKEGIKNFAEKTKDRYGDFDIIDQGGMGIVYKAIDKKLNRTVAIKVISKELSEHPEHIARFRREAQAVAALNHPNIIAIYDIITEDQPFMVMEYFSGWNLSREISKRDTLSYVKIYKIIHQFVNAMAYAHSKGVLHRDIKPDNIMLNQEALIKITDFGLAKCMYLTEMTVSGFYGGTPTYMAPEQKKSGTTDQRTDIFAFGVVFLELLTGKLAAQKNLEDFKNDFMNLPLSQRSWETFRPIILKCLEIDPQDRFQSFDQIAAELSKLPASD